MDNSKTVDRDLQVLTPEEVAKTLDLKKSHVIRLLRNGELKGFRINKFWRITRDSLDSYISNLSQKGQGKAGLSRDTLNKIRYHASLKSKDATPNGIDKLTDDIAKLKSEIQSRDRFGKIPRINKLKSNVEQREEKRQRLDELPAQLDDLSDEAYPGIKELVDEDPDDLEAMFAGKVQKPAAEKRRMMRNLPVPRDTFSDDEAYPAAEDQADERPWRVMKGEDDS